ncbi:MAG: altronate dehydratase [Clostridiales bacterium]|nr:altronate dehydratase [Clostridiales bacterium]
MTGALRIHPADNVLVALRDLNEGETALGVRLTQRVPAGHKAALAPIASGERVIKYGSPIGVATADIPAGAWVHTHNVKTLLSGELTYPYRPLLPAAPAASDAAFSGYPRRDGRVGIRNEVWIIPTVGCVSRTAEAAAERARALFGDRVDGIYAFPHVHGCSQMGDDQENTQRTLAAPVNHPNAGAALVMGLGCENNCIDRFRPFVGDQPEGRVRYVNCQDEPDEIESALRRLDALTRHAAEFRRQPCPIDRLVVGLKCGGSDGFSGITANPLLGALSDHLCGLGATALLTEVPEMFGAEHLLIERCADRAAFDQVVEMVNGFKRYFARHGQPCSENPSPGNKAGGITTLEDKSLGCVQKGGHVPVVGALPIGQAARGPGLLLVDGPGNDLVACTALAAAGAQLVLFTTGRGTPYGGPVPTLKISTNSALAGRKPGWIDFDAGRLAQGEPMETLLREFVDLVLDTAGGRPAKNEVSGYREIAIFKDGVTM